MHPHPRYQPHRGGGHGRHRCPAKWLAPTILTVLTEPTPDTGCRPLWPGECGERRAQDAAPALQAGGRQPGAHEFIQSAQSDIYQGQNIGQLSMLHESESTMSEVMSIQDIPEFDGLMDGWMEGGWCQLLDVGTVWYRNHRNCRNCHFGSGVGGQV